MNQVEVTFALDANGILAVTAQDTVTGAKAGAEIKAKDGRLSADEIDKMVADAEKHRAQDDELADKVCTALPSWATSLHRQASSWWSHLLCITCCAHCLSNFRCDTRDWQ